MALVVADRIKETTTTTGTGTYTLAGAVVGFEAFSSIGDGNTTYYCCTDGTDFEVGIGTYTSSGTTLARTTVLQSSNSDNAVNWTAGERTIFVTQPAEKAVYLDASGYIAAFDGRNLTNVDAETLDSINSTSFLRNDNGDIAVGSNKITGLATPTANTDAATKAYVDSLSSTAIHIHDPVRVELPDSYGNLSGTYDNGTAGVGATLTNNSTQVALSIDGVTLSTSDRVLLYNQTDATENGVYTVTNTGSASTNWVLTRATDADSSGIGTSDALDEGSYFYVDEGNTGAGESYVCNVSGTITFGTTDITFAKFGESVSYTGGTGIDINVRDIVLDLSELTTSTSDGDGDFFAVVDSANAQKKLTKANINLSGFNNDSGFLTEVSNLTISNFAGSTIQLSSESFSDVDTALMTAAAINDRILSFGYTTNVGDITGVTAGTGLSGGGSSGTVSLSLDGTGTVGAGTYGSTSDLTKIDTITVDAFGRVTAVATGNTGDGGNATTLDTLDSTQFLRSDAADTKTSGDLTFNDDIKAIFGTGDDLSIYHDGTDSYVSNKTGDLYIGANDTSDVGGDVYIRAKIGENDTSIILNDDDRIDYYINGSLRMQMYGVINYSYADLRLQGFAYDLVYDKGTYTTTLTSANPASQNQTITLPDATGTVPVFTTAPTGAIADGTNGQVLTTDGSGALSFTTVSGGGSGLSNLVEDTTPQLGGTLDTNNQLVQFGDSSGATVNRLQLGASQDLSVYHDGTNSYIDQNDATLFIRNTSETGNASGNAIDIRNADDTGIEIPNNSGVVIKRNGSTSVSFTGVGSYFNTDIVLNGSTRELKFRDTTAGDFDLILDAAQVTDSDKTVTLPNLTGTVPVFTTAPTAAITDGTNGQVLTTNGSGTLTFTTVSGGGGITTGKAIAMAMIFG